ncbi:MAG: PDZ domain-containing protein [Acidobacteriaceae bacterium]
MKHLPFLSIAAVCLMLPAPPGTASPAAPLSGIASFHHRGDGYLGVNFENLTGEQRKNLSVAPKEGVAIAAVDHDAPAGKAGLRANDVILKMNGKKVQHAEDLVDALHKMDPGQTVVLDVERAGRQFEISIALADRKTLEQEAWSKHYSVPDPQQRPVAQTGFFAAVPSEIGKTFSANGGLMSYIPGTPPYTGITLDVMNSQLARYFGLRNSTGLLVKSIDPSSPASRAGLHAGDVICKANDVPMISRSRWNHALRENRHQAVKLQILRERRSQILVLTLAANKS